MCVNDLKKKRGARPSAWRTDFGSELLVVLGTFQVVDELDDLLFDFLEAGHLGEAHAASAAGQRVDQRELGPAHLRLSTHTQKKKTE